MDKTRQKTSIEPFELDAFLKENEYVLDQFPYDTASSHYNSEGYPLDLSPYNAFTHLGIYLGWAIERGLVSNIFKDKNKDKIKMFQKGNILPGELFRLCCGDEFTKAHLNEQGNAFTEEYYRPGWDHYYHEDYDVISGHEVSGFYMKDSWENYQKVKTVIDGRYEEWFKEYGRNYKRKE